MAKLDQNADLTSNEEGKHDNVDDQAKVDPVSNLLSSLTFEDIGICSEICEALKAMGYVHPTKI